MEDYLQDYSDEETYNLLGSDSTSSVTKNSGQENILRRIVRLLCESSHTLSPDDHVDVFSAQQLAIIDKYVVTSAPEYQIWNFIFHPDVKQDNATRLKNATECLLKYPHSMHAVGPLGALPMHLAAIIDTDFLKDLFWAMIDLDEGLRSQDRTDLISQLSARTGRPPEDIAARLPPQQEWTAMHPLRLILRPYHSDDPTDDVFHGENLLHIAIVLRRMMLRPDQDPEPSLAFTRALLDRAPELMVGRVSGSFFEPGKPCYFGSTPLHFAVATNQPDIAHLILERAPIHARFHERSLTGVPGHRDHPECAIGSDARMCVQRLRMLHELDHWGNNVLHVIVWRSDPNNRGRGTLIGMWDWVVAMETQLRRAVYAETHVPPMMRLDRSLNRDRMTPLVLAADLGRRNLFLHIIRKDSIVNWRFGPLVCRSYALDWLDQTHPDAPDAPTALKRLVDKGSDPNIKRFFGIGMIQRILNRKWNYYARHIFHVRLIATLLYAMVMIVLAIAENVIAPDATPPPSPATRAHAHTTAIVCKALLLLGAILQFAKEVRQVLDGGLWGYITDTGAAFMENLCNWIFFFFFLCTAICEVLHAPTALTHACMALTVLAVFAYFFFFCLGFQLTGAYVVMIGRMLMTDLARFSLAFLVVVLCFGSAFHILFRSASLFDFGLTLRDTFLLALGQIDPNQFFVKVHTPWFCTSIMILYIMIVNILLMNLLIATMAQTYASMLPEGRLTWLVERARITETLIQEFNPTPTRLYYVCQTPTPDDGLPPDVDPSRWARRPYLLVLDSLRDDEATLCEEDKQRLRGEEKETE